MNDAILKNMPVALRVAAGTDRFGEQRGLGMSTIAFKMTTPNTGDIFILENTFLAKGGPARHLHYDQDEWSYILEGEFQLEVGGDGCAFNRVIRWWRHARFLMSGHLLVIHEAEC